MTHDPILTTRVGPLELANPIMPASGCFGPELSPLVRVEALGAVVTKTVFPGRRSGNGMHRLTDLGAAMLNSVGIPSPGVPRFIDEILPGYLAAGPPVVVSVGGLSAAEYWEVVEGLADQPIAAFEVNVSCPNLEAGGLQIGTDPELVGRVTSGVRERSGGRPVFVKLTPNVTAIAPIARAAADAGADALTVANTFVGMAIDIRNRRPVLGNAVGGVSGPATKPMVLRLLRETVTAVDLPVIGCGGVTSASDVVEYVLAGASAVQVGTATFGRPTAMTEILEDLPGLLGDLGAGGIGELVGAIRDEPDTDDPETEAVAGACNP